MILPESYFLGGNLGLSGKLFNYNKGGNIMFGFGKISKLQERIVALEKDIVPCHTCKALFWSHTLQSKAVRSNQYPEKIYFCDAHKVRWSYKTKYSVFDVVLGQFTGGTAERYYLESVECDKNGKPFYMSKKKKHG